MTNKEIVEFFEALKMLAKEKGIDVEYLLERIRAAIVVAVKKDFGGKENSIVVIPIIIMGIHIDISRKAKETPTARASMLVATARVSMCQNPQPPDTSSSSLENDSFTILAPIKVSKSHATQWSH